MDKCKHEFITRYYLNTGLDKQDYCDDSNCIQVAEVCEYCKEVIRKFD